MRQIGNTPQYSVLFQVSERLLGVPAGELDNIPNSNQPQPLEARVAFLADDDVVVDRDAQGLRHLDDLLGHLDVGA